MDITFEEVANVIQDARYQQAILDPDIPKPDRKFPSPPKGFNVDEFAKERNISITTVVSEPLGRWFLSLFLENNEEKKLLQYAEAMFGLRTMDPGGIVRVGDIEALNKRFELNPLIMNADSFSTAGNSTVELSLDSFNDELELSDSVDDSVIALRQSAMSDNDLTADGGAVIDRARVGSKASTNDLPHLASQNMVPGSSAKRDQDEASRGVTETLVTRFDERQGMCVWLLLF